MPSKPFNHVLPKSHGRPFAEKARSHPEFRATIIDCLQTFQDEQRDNANLIADEASHVGYYAAVKEMTKEIAAMFKTAKKNNWTAEEALKVMEQYMERMDSSNGQAAAQEDKSVSKYIQESAHLAWDQAACCVDHAEDIAQVDQESIRCAMLADDTLEAALLSEAKPEALALALADSLSRATDGELIYAAQALKHGADKAGHWRFIAELSLA